MNELNTVWTWWGLYSAADGPLGNLQPGWPLQWSLRDKGYVIISVLRWLDKRWWALKSGFRGRERKLRGQSQRRKRRLGCGHVSRQGSSKASGRAQTVAGTYYQWIQNTIVIIVFCIHWYYPQPKPLIILPVSLTFQVF